MLKEKVSEAGKSSGKGKAPTEMVEWEKEIKELEDLVLLDMNAKVCNIFNNKFTDCKKNLMQKKLCSESS